MSHKTQYAANMCAFRQHCPISTGGFRFRTAKTPPPRPLAPCLRLPAFSYAVRFINTTKNHTRRRPRSDGSRPPRFPAAPCAVPVARPVSIPPTGSDSRPATHHPDGHGFASRLAVPPSRRSRQRRNRPRAAQRAANRPPLQGHLTRLETGLKPSRRLALTADQRPTTPTVKGSPPRTVGRADPARRCFQPSPHLAI